MLWFSAARRLKSLEERCEKLAKDQQSLELEWINFFDKAKRMMGRIVKRAAVVESADTQAEPVGPDNGGPPRLRSGLTSRQVEIQQQILRRRGIGGVG